MKKVALILMMVMISICGIALSENPFEEVGEFYPRLTVVVGREMEEVYCLDQNGDVWSFFDPEYEYERGDICNLLMWATDENTHLHEIIETYWVGYVENVDIYCNIMGWE